jgi:hypothetical protein
MTHEELRDRLLDLAYGELSPREARAVEAHAASCGACGAELARIRGTRRIMASLPQEPAPEGGERILLAAAREAAGRRTHRAWLPRWVWAAAAAASLVVVGAVSWRIAALRPAGVGREDPQALMDESRYAREPREAPPGDAATAKGDGRVGALGPMAERAPPPPAAGEAERSPPARPGRAADEGRSEGAGPPRTAQLRKFAAPPPEAPAPREEPPRPAARLERDRPEDAAAAPPAAGAGPAPAVPAPSPAPSQPPAAAAPRPQAAEERPAPAARQRAMSAQAAREAPRADATPPSAPPPLLRYEDLRRSGLLRGEIRTFPGCEGEAWRKVERDPDGRVVSYTCEGDLGGRRVRIEAVYGPDGAPARVTVRDARTMAPLEGATPWVPRAAEADGPPRCTR